MAISKYVKHLREKIGSGLLMMPCVAAVIRNEKGLLLQKRDDDGRWALPGGAIDPGEAPAQALIREVREEAGLHVRPARLLGVFGAVPDFRHVYPNGDEVHAIVNVFLCEVTGGELKSRDGESMDLRYFTPQEAARLAPKYEAAILSGDGGSAYFEWREDWIAK